MRGLIKRIKAAFLAFLKPEIVDSEDVLTGALTRKKFEQLAGREIARAQRGHQPLSLVFIDLDGLKQINDTSGHKAGDQYLKEFAQIALVKIRPYDLLARIGGDEFILFLPGADEVEAISIIQRIYNLFPDFSWGVSSWTEGMNLGNLLHEADQKMYQAKIKKKNRAEV